MIREGGMDKRVSIASFTDGLQSYPDDVALIAIDVIRATTTAVTAIATGRRCFPVATVPEALERSRTLWNPLLVGELGGEMPSGFDLTNSPAQLSERSDLSRPVVLLSTSGTQLIQEIANRRAAYVCSFRNYNATIDHLARHHSSVAVIGAGSRGEFREEDQMCCAWMAEGLIENGFKSEDQTTQNLVERWRGVPKNAFLASRSVDYLRNSDQLQDLDFILDHFDDVNVVCRMASNEIVGVNATVIANGV